MKLAEKPATAYIRDVPEADTARALHGMPMMPAMPSLPPMNPSWGCSPPTNQ